MKIHNYILTSLIDILHPKRIFSNIRNYLDLKRLTLKKKYFKKYKNNSSKNVLMFGRLNLSNILLQLPQIFACKRNNYKIIILLSSPCWSVKKIYKIFGVTSFLYYYNTFDSIHPKTKLYVDLILKDEENKKSYLGVDVFKLLISTEMRLKKKGNINFKKYTIKYLTKQISRCLNIADFSQRIIGEYRPKIFFFEDRGYIPEGIFFSNAIYNKIDVIEVHTGHKSGIFSYKRYNLKNKLIHPYSLSIDLFNKFKKKNFSKKKKEDLFNELESCYQNGDWFSEVGTAFFKKEIDKKQFYKKYNLNPKYKTAVLFTHILWDATFFFGEDIFKNYEDWLVQSLEKMTKVDNVNWVVKCHPANNVKNIRDGTSVYSEIELIKKKFKKLPKNIKILDHNSNISTLSLFKFIDFCITVRGTVGMEASCYGIPVITAGTGRYDRLGFTFDSNSKQEYFDKLSNINNLKINSKKKELAIKFLYCSLICKKLKSEIVTFQFNKTSDAKLDIKLNHNIDFFKSNDVIKISEWLKSKNEDLIDYDTF